ncbi:hypothetical protein Ancab_001033 [Ancistrocladus abbreviatus]
MAAKSTDQSSFEAIAGNEDLLTEILYRLPAKCLLRLKSVSKQWLNLISSPGFSLLHSRRHPNPPCSALFFNHSLSASTSSLSSNFDFIPLQHHPAINSPPFLSRFTSSSISILQSSNGLLLCKSVSQSKLTYYVCNPTINQISQLPFPIAGTKLGSQSISIVGLNLAFDPSRSSDYKVICVWKDNSCGYIDEIYHGIDVYSPVIGEWRPSVDFFTPLFDIEFDRGVFCNGNIHWLSNTENTIFYDVENECLKPLTLPPAVEGAYLGRFRYFGESRGHLHLVDIPRNSVSEFDVLVLDGDHMCWTVKYRVQDCRDRFGLRFRFYAFSILGIVRGEEDEDSVLILSTPGKVLSYNFGTMITRSLYDVIDHADKWLPFKGYDAYQYIPTLYCVR